MPRRGRAWASLGRLLAALCAAACVRVQAAGVAGPLLCPDGVTECPAGGLCCAVGDGTYGCCSSGEGVCCRSASAVCCPGGYTCGAGAQSERCTAASPATQPPWTPAWHLCHPPSLQAHHLPLPAPLNGLTFPYYATHAIPAAGGALPELEAAVVVVHGAARNADEYYCSMIEAAQLQPYLRPAETKVLVLAPHFMQANDNPPAGTVYWSGADPNGVWRYGAESEPVAPSTATLSSFAVLDSIVTALQDTSRFPNLALITLVGHSSGGQTVQRYTLSTPLALGPRVQTVVANPSSYAYLDRRRWNGSGFAIPTASVRRNCSEYDAWEFGLNGDNMPPYVARVPARDMIARYPARRVRYLAGQNDTCNEHVDPGCHSHGLETTCMDMLEGWNRRNRSALYFTFLELFYGHPTHNRSLVPNSAHDHTLMFQSGVGLASIFRPWDNPPGPAAEDRRAQALLGVTGALSVFGLAVCLYLHCLRPAGLEEDAASGHPAPSLRFKYRPLATNDGEGEGEGAEESLLEVSESAGY